MCWLAKAHLGSLEKISRMVRLGVYIATTGKPADLVKIADGASELLRDALGADKIPARLVIGVASLPFNTPVELEAIFEVSE
jgi:enamine deaminase RidA (YjgF/YER057c/UK114 family)